MTRRLLILCAGFLALWAQAENPKKQVFRLDVKQDTKTLDGKIHAPAVAPLIPVRLGVIQLEGAKHPDKDILTCTPGTDEEHPHALVLRCEDSKWIILGIEWGQQ